MPRVKNSNAIKHGAYSIMIFLPEEDREEFKALYEALKEEWDPQGPTQEDKVFNIAQNMWRKRRSHRYRRKMAEIGEMKLWLEEIEIEQLLDFLDDAEAGKPISELKLPPEWQIHCDKNMPRKNYDSDDAWLKAVTDLVNWLLDQLGQLRGKYTKEKVVDRFSDPDVIAKELALEERIDAKIDRDIVSLGRMKTMQSMGLGRRRKEPALEDQSMKQIDSPPIQPEPPTDELPKVSDTP